MDNYKKFHGALADYQATIRERIEDECTRTIEMVQRNFIDGVKGNENDQEPAVYFIKMKADFLRYKCIVADEENIDGYISECGAVY